MYKQAIWVIIQAAFLVSPRFCAIDDACRGNAKNIYLDTNGSAFPVANLRSLDDTDADGDGFYENDLDCLWIIVGEANTFIELTITSLDIEPSGSEICHNDFLAVYDGPNIKSKEIKAFCEYDYTATETLNSTSNFLTLEFRSDFNEVGRGFKAVFKQRDPFAHGAWSVWSNWSGCMLINGVALRKRSRMCTRPAGGMHCQGDKSMVENCTIHEIGTWGVWGNWSECSINDGIGMRKRTRACIKHASGTACPGTAIMVEECTVLRLTCFPNNTILIEDLPPYVRSIMAHNHGHLCTVSKTSPWIITDCGMHKMIFFTAGDYADLTADRIQGGRHGRVITTKIMCNQLEEVTLTVDSGIYVTLPNTLDFTAIPTYNVDMAVRLSVTGTTRQTQAFLGQVLHLTIDVPTELTMVPITCIAYEGTTVGTANSQELITNGCTQDTALIENFRPDPLAITSVSKRYSAIVYAFKFLEQDHVLFQCRIRVCPLNSNNCIFSCSPGQRRRRQSEILEEDDSYIATATTVLMVTSQNSGTIISNSFSTGYGLLTLMAVLAAMLL